MRVLVVDGDLEAPGLDRYFQGFDVQPPTGHVGFLHLLNDASAPDAKPRWEDYISSVDVGGEYNLKILTSGRSEKDPAYDSKVLDFDWNSFFKESDGGEFIESLRRDWTEQFDVTLIDSRTGITDSGGICTIQLPDVLIIVFTANEQSLFGVKEVAKQAQKGRQKLAYDRMPLLVYPLPARFDSRTEFEESEKWLGIFADELAEFYEDWLPRPYTPANVLDKTKLPYVAYFSFGEKLPVEEGTSDPEGLGHAYEVTAHLIANGFSDVDESLFKDTASNHVTRLNRYRN
jgi:hypothetical protein